MFIQFFFLLLTSLKYQYLLEIDNETDIGRSIMTNPYNVMCFPFAANIQESINYISISNRAHKGRFHDPPTSSAEKDYQEYFKQHCIPLTGTLMVHDTHLIPILDRSKPDFVGIAKDLSLDPLNVSLIIETKPNNLLKCRCWTVGLFCFKNFSNSTNTYFCLWNSF